MQPRWVVGNWDRPPADGGPLEHQDRPPRIEPQRAHVILLVMPRGLGQTEDIDIERSDALRVPNLDSHVMNAVGLHRLRGFVPENAPRSKRLPKLQDRLIRVIRPTDLERWRIHRKIDKAKLRPHQVQLDAGSMFCWVGGSGPPLLLLHGFGASAKWQFHPQVPALARHYTLYIPDLLFFGGSTSHHPDRSLDFQATAVMALMDHFGVERFDTLGISYGGFVAYLLATEYPDRVGKLVLTNSPGAVMGAEDYARLLNTFEVDCITELLLPTEPDGVRRLLEVAYHRPPWVPKFALIDARRQLFTDQVKEKRELLLELVGYLDDPPSGEEPVRNDTLIVWGEHDRVFPVGLGRKLARSMGDNARLEVLDRTAHAPNIEQGAAFNELVLAFLRNR